MDAYFVSFFQALNFSIVSFMLNFLSFPAPKKEQCCLSFKKKDVFFYWLRSSESTHLLLCYLRKRDPLPVKADKIK